MVFDMDTNSSFSNTYFIGVILSYMIWDAQSEHSQ